MTKLCELDSRFGPCFNQATFRVSHELSATKRVCSKHLPRAIRNVSSEAGGKLRRRWVEIQVLPLDRAS